MKHHERRGSSSGSYQSGRKKLNCSQSNARRKICRAHMNPYSKILQRLIVSFPTKSSGLRSPIRKLGTNNHLIKTSRVILCGLTKGIAVLFLLIIKRQVNRHLTTNYSKIQSRRGSIPIFTMRRRPSFCNSYKSKFNLFFATSVLLGTGFFLFS